MELTEIAEILSQRMYSVELEKKTRQSFRYLAAPVAQFMNYNQLFFLYLTEKPEKEIKTSTVPTAILAPPVGSAPIPVSNKPVVVTSNRVQPAAVHSTVHPSVPSESVANTAEVIKPQEAVLAVSAVKANSPITAASTSVNSFTTPGGWNSAIISKTVQTTDKPKTELTLEERVSILIVLKTLRAL